MNKLLFILCIVLGLQAKITNINFSLAPTVGASHLNGAYGASIHSGIIINSKHRIYGTGNAAASIDNKLLNNDNPIVGGGIGYGYTFDVGSKVKIIPSIQAGCWAVWYTFKPLDEWIVDNVLVYMFVSDYYYVGIPISMEIGNKVPRFYMSSKILIGEKVANLSEVGVSFHFER